MRAGHRGRGRGRRGGRGWRSAKRSRLRKLRLRTFTVLIRLLMPSAGSLVARRMIALTMPIDTGQSGACPHGAWREAHTPKPSLRRRPRGGKPGCRPLRDRSSSPSRRSRKKRFRHLLTTGRARSRRSPISLFSSPSAANSTILARTTSQYDNVYWRDLASRTRRSSGVRAMTYGLDLAGRGRSGPLGNRLWKRQERRDCGFVVHQTA